MTALHLSYFVFFISVVLSSFHFQKWITHLCPLIHFDSLQIVDPYVFVLNIFFSLVTHNRLKQFRVHFLLPRRYLPNRIFRFLDKDIQASYKISLLFFRMLILLLLDTTIFYHLIFPSQSVRGRQNYCRCPRSQSHVYVFVDYAELSTQSTPLWTRIFQSTVI